MSKFVVIVFPNEEQVTAGAKLLDELNEQNSLSLYATAILGKDSDGRVTQKERSGRGPRGLTLGALVGGLVGMLGGPAVAAVGAAGGALMGGWHDMMDLEVGIDFLEEVSRELKPGHWALVAALEEEWVTPLDSAMESAGGRVVRARQVDFEDDRVRREIEVARRELSDYEAELEQAAEEAKARLAARRKEAQARIQRSAERTEARIARLREEADAKIDALEERAAAGASDSRKRIDSRIEAVRSDYEKRAAKLKEALKLAREALD
ncbi:MAG TPA: DUF1269 domain-containing protein [Kiloniellales bacterium]|nr:DUF1269 domain-containing protein [Kiloniellales bacterium]